MRIQLTKITEELIERCAETAENANCEDCACDEKECLEYLLEELAKEGAEE